MIYKLSPHAVTSLIFQKRSHHLAIAFQDARAARMIRRQRAEKFGHASSDPPVAASPEKWRIGRVIKKSVRLLQLVEVYGHFEGRAIQIFRIPSRAIRLHLDEGDHVHIINPEARLVRETFRSGIGPLLVRQFPAEVEVYRLLRLNVDFEWNRAKNSEVNMRRVWNQMRVLI